MSSDLLKREQELTMLNNRLELRSKQLITEAETVMNTHKYIHIDNNEPVTNINKPTNEKKEIDVTSKEDLNDNWEGFPEGCRDMGRKPLIQFLKAKATILQNDLDQLKAKYKIKFTEFKNLEQEYEKLQEDRNKWKRLAGITKEQKEKLSQQIISLQSVLQTRDSQIANLKKENETLQKDFKNVNTSNASQDFRLNKALEELERVKINLSNSKKNEKELREAHKKETTELIMLNKKLEKQTNDLTSGFKKQLQLIDNLKKQKMYLETLKITEMAEDEFLKILDWKPDSVLCKK